VAESGRARTTEYVGSSLNLCVVIPTRGLITRAISCAISCAICCISQMRFAAFEIWCPTRNCYRLHVPCDFACDLLCDLVHAIWCMQYFCATAKRTRNRTPNRICDLVQKKIESDSCRTPYRRYTKSHLQNAANRAWNRTQNRSCNRPQMQVNVFLWCIEGCVNFKYLYCRWVYY
jgi:hypothetical protein